MGAREEEVKSAHRAFCAKAYRIAESLIEIGNSGEGRKILRGKMVDS